MRNSKKSPDTTNLGSDADLKGIAQAQLLIYNKLDPKTGRLVVEGTGKIDVPTGRMYNLPIMLDLVKVFQTPDTRQDCVRAGARGIPHPGRPAEGGSTRHDRQGNLRRRVGRNSTSRAIYVKFEFYTVWSQVLKQMIKHAGGRPDGVP